MRTRLTIGLLLAAFALAVSRPGASDHPVLQAIEDEMARSMAELRMKDQPPPYYIAYTLDDVIETNVSASLGGVVDDFSNHSRLLRVDVRVGDYTFDSSRFLSYEREAGVMSGYSITAGISCALDDDYDAVRRQVWLITDAAYKRALSLYAKKRAMFQNRAEADAIPDFSRETPVVAISPVTVSPPVLAAWPAVLSRLSAVFTAFPDVWTSQATLSVRRGTRYFLNTEGFRTSMLLDSATLLVQAETQADDGMRLKDYWGDVETRVEDLPGVDESLARVREMAGRLVSLRAAPIGDEYSGPMLVEGQASAELLAQELVPLFLSQRLPESDTPRGDLLGRQQGTPYATRLGSRVLPGFLSVSDTPSLATYANRPVPGAYAIDDEGIRAQDVPLVEDGKLLTLLTSRTPQKRLLTSNGHGRAGGAMAGVFQVAASPGVPRAALKEKYLELLKQQDRPYGFIVRGLVGASARLADASPDEFSAFSELMQGGTGTVPRIANIVRVSQDGREEPVRGLVFGDVTRTAFKDILEASADRTLYNYRASASTPGSMMGSEATVTVITPDFIYDELELQKSRDVPQKRPIVRPPSGK